MKTLRKDERKIGEYKVRAWCGRGGFWNITLSHDERETIQVYCRASNMPGAFIAGKIWVDKLDGLYQGDY